MLRYHAGKKAKECIDIARSQIAKMLNCCSDGMFLTLL